MSGAGNLITKPKTGIIPEVINAYNAYNLGNQFIGVTGTVSLPTLEAITETIQGAGILGTYETAVVGNFGSLEQEINFRTLEEDIFSLMDPTKNVDLTFRASVQGTKKDTGAISYRGMRIVERGRFKSFTPGKLELGKAMDGTLKLELFYLLVELNENKLLEYDKLNGVFVVNGVDMLEKVRAFS